MSERTQIVSYLVLTKPIACQREQNFISTCVEQSLRMPAITQYAYQLVFNKSNTCQLAHKLHLYMSWTKSLNASEAKRCISTCIDQNHPMPARTKNASQHVLTKHASEYTKFISTNVDQINPFQREHKMNLNLRWTEPSHACENTICFSTCHVQNPPLPAEI